MNEIEKLIFQNLVGFSAEDMDRINSKIKVLPLEQLTIFYRGDNRKYEDLTTGFSPWQELSLDRIKTFAAAFLENNNIRRDFWNWWKYPSNRTINTKNNPFIATGIHDTHLGSNEYIITIPSLKMHTISNGLFKFSIGFNGDNLFNSTIIALKIDAEEVVFGTNIPLEFISKK